MAASFTNTFFIVFKCKEAEVWTSSKKFRNCLSDIHLVFYWVVIVSLTVTYTNFINIIKKNKFVWALKIQFVIVIVVVIAFFFKIWMLAHFRDKFDCRTVCPLGCENLDTHFVRTAGYKEDEG